MRFVKNGGFVCNDCNPEGGGGGLYNGYWLALCVHRSAFALVTVNQME